MMVIRCNDKSTRKIFGQGAALTITSVYSVYTASHLLHFDISVLEEGTLAIKRDFFVKPSETNLTFWTITVNEYINVYVKMT